MNEKTSINSMCPNLWTGLLQGLTVMQQCVYQISLEMFVKSRSDWYSLDWSGAELYLNEWRKLLLACVRIVDQHFKQFCCKQLKNRQLSELSATMSEM